ncbi:unnamed protein product [Spodoptera littoralis]|uniref:HAT C-terminal dimerisation domain-containing protein n=1 Tax=Spodoptera littoralis TaxID=7109 RepID=A0A9P0N720_SPOLI|nr:unnamed protein product [Spodoptera littoralis]CAH1647440.1 unnamed protein product [Spodoptera littoralis]
MEIPYRNNAYVQKFRSLWQYRDEFKDWLKVRPASGKASQVFCTYCFLQMDANLVDIREHAKTIMHKKKLASKTGIKEIPLKVTAKNRSTRISNAAEGALTLFIAEHCSTMSVDNLAEHSSIKEIPFKVIANESSSGTSDAAEDALTLFNAKNYTYTETMRNMLASHFRQQLLDDIGNQKFSIFFNESTDFSLTKYLGLVIRYYSNNQKKIVNSFLELITVETADATGIVDGLVACLKNHKLNINQLIGIGTDNALFMTRINNGVRARLQRDYGLKHLILIRCVCHSLQLAVTHACKGSMPKKTEYLVREIYMWFSVSPKRKYQYKNIYEKINCGETAYKMTKFCDNCWLSIEPAVTNILSQWKELIWHFKVATVTEKCYAAERIYYLLKDKRNYLYLIFLRSILNDVQIAVKAFECEDSYPLKQVIALKTLIVSLSKKILTPTAWQKDISEPIYKCYMRTDPFLGDIFEIEITKYSFDPETLKTIRQRCVNFLILLLKELRQRIPDNYKQLESIHLLSYEEAVKSKKTYEIINLAEILGYPPEQILKLWTQWKILYMFKWGSQEIMSFWNEVKNYNNNVLADISEFAILCLSLPLSNAEVERLFSEMNLLKSKQGDRMSLMTLNSILCIRDSLRKNGLISP